ncbi:MAG: hypothetical protein WAW88_00475 [Nocardioides sp.]
MRGVWVRWVVVWAAMLLVGTAAGYAVAQRQELDPPTEVGTAKPMAAAPRAPGDIKVAPDPDYPALTTKLAYTRITEGQPPYRYTWLAPKEWRRAVLGIAEWRWYPADVPSETYRLRVEIVSSQRDTLTSILNERVADLRGDVAIRNLTILKRDETNAILSYSYITESNRRRFSTLRWFDPSGGQSAVVEVSYDGRAVDVPGLESLANTVWASVAAAG